jgi:site-specific recombinase XerD
VIRPVGKGGHVGAVALSGRSVAAIVKQHAERAGLDPVDYAGHSLRAGFITSAAEDGAALLKIADQSRHKSLDTLRGYVRRADMFRDHAGASFL